MKVRAFVEKEVGTLDPIREIVYATARMACRKAGKEVRKYCELVSRTRSSIPDLEEQKEALREEIGRLEGILEEGNRKLRELKGRRKRLLTLYNKERKVGEASRLEELESEICEVSYDIEETKNSMRTYGRMGSDHAGHQISVLRRKLEELERAVPVFIPCVDGKLVEVYDDPEEEKEVASIIYATLRNLANGKLKSLGLAEREDYFYSSLSCMREDDFEFRPFEHGVSGSSALRRCFYRVVEGKIMKFARKPLERLFRESEFATQSYMKEGMSI